MNKMTNLKSLDSFTLSGNIYNNFSCEYSADDRIFIGTEMGVYVLSLRGNLQSTFKYFSCRKTFFQPTGYTPCANVGMDVNNFAFELDKDDLYETALRSELSATIKGAKPVAPLCLHSAWSPAGVVGKTDCLLGVRTNLSSVELYARHIDEHNLLKYVNVGNVVGFLIDIESRTWKSGLRLPGPKVKLKEYCRRIERVAATAFTWTHLFSIEGKEYCVLCVGHYDGSVTFFAVESLENNSPAKCNLKYLGRYVTKLKQIAHLYWHPTKKCGGGLCIGDIEGKMSILNVDDLDRDVVFANNETEFYTQVDKVISAIKVIVIGDYTVVMLVKQSHIVFYALNSIGKVFACFVYDAKNFYITGLQAFGDILYILTFNGSLKKLKISIVNDELKVEEHIIPIKFDSAKFRTHGLFLSCNKIIFGVIAYPCRVVERANTKVHVFLYYDTNLNPFEILMENSSGYLTHYWDVFETLRLAGMKEHKFPWIGIDPDLNYDNLSLLQVKTLMHISKLSESIFSFVPTIPKYDIKPHIILQYLLEIKLIVRRLNYLLSPEKKLTLFQLQSMDIQLFYLKEIVLKNILAKANVGKKFTEEIYNVMALANEVRYPDPPQCFWCGEKIIGTWCLPPHSDNRCCYSSMPINLRPAYFCAKCDSVAHEEIAREFCPVLCPYCDVPMCKMKQIEANNTELSLTGLCFDDCLTDDIGVEDIEENSSDYVIVSSDDSENEDKDRSSLSELYFKVSGMSLEEMGNVESEMKGEKYESDLCGGPSKMCRT